MKSTYQSVLTGPSKFLIALALGSCLALILTAATPAGNRFVPVLVAIAGMMIVWIVIGVWSTVLLIISTRTRSWSQIAAPAFLVLASSIVASNFFGFMGDCDYLGGALRFAINRSYYERQVSLLSSDERPKLAVFNWGGMIWASRGIVYDESDEVALPPGQQSVTWKASPHLHELTCGNWVARSLWSHYYLVEFLC